MMSKAGRQASGGRKGGGDGGREADGVEVVEQEG